MGKHLSLSDRALIERCLVHDYTFATIARKLNRSPTTISREVNKHRVFVNRIDSDKNDCVDYIRCLRRNLCDSETKYSCLSRCKLCNDYDCRTLCKVYVSKHCTLLDKPPYVCTNCPNQKSCRKNHAYYTAHRAHAEYQRELKQSRQGLHASAEELIEIGNLISPLIMKGQSINHIFSTHADEIGFSERTLYNYIDLNSFKVKNIDLPKKVRYKKRRQKKVLTKFEYKCRRGRTYEDFKSYLELHPKTSIVEMDTVKGARAKGKVLLTMIFRNNNFMLMFIMNDGTQKSVTAVFDNLTKLLGVDTFRKLFPVILTDNGVEFKDPEKLEHTLYGSHRTRIFYCDPQASWQKPHIEKNHTLIRRIIPKGISLTPFIQDDISLACCHINSVPRELFNNYTPFDLMQRKAHKKLLNALNLSPVPPDEVCLKPDFLNTSNNVFG